MRRLLIAALLAVVALLGGRSVLQSPSDPPSRAAGTVTRVVDGDTLHVDVRGRDVTVRLIGIDTPEVSPAECGADQATRLLEELADGRRVRLVGDPSQDERDRYGRRLAYVLADGVDVGEVLVRRGWARVYVFDRPFARLSRYRKAARRAPERCAAS